MIKLGEAIVCNRYVSMVKLCVTPEKVGNDMRFFDVVEAPGNSRAGAVPTSGSCGSFLGESVLVSASGTSSSA